MCPLRATIYWPTGDTHSLWQAPGRLELRQVPNEPKSVEARDTIREKKDGGEVDIVVDGLEELATRLRELRG